MKILVVDDEALLVKGIRFNLQSEGYEVITGSDGLDAVAAVQEQSPDLVILDVMMPNMDGLTACSKIREFSDVPIILLTAKTDDMDKLMGFDQGADDYLTKPFNILELKARIRALLRRTTLQQNATGAVNQLADILHDQHTPGGFLGGTDGVCGHSQQAAQIANDQTDIHGIFSFDLFCAIIPHPSEKSKFRIFLSPGLAKQKKD